MEVKVVVEGWHERRDAPLAGVQNIVRGSSSPDGCNL
jgi:hypothetical protein